MQHGQNITEDGGDVEVKCPPRLPVPERAKMGTKHMFLYIYFLCDINLPFLCIVYILCSPNNSLAASINEKNKSDARIIPDCAGGYIHTVRMFDSRSLRRKLNAFIPGEVSCLHCLFLSAMH